jgi:uridine kinase
MSEKTVIVGIAGGTCSGKSTLVEELKKRLSEKYRVRSFMMDMYFKKDGPMVVAPFSQVEYVERNHPNAIDLDRLYAEFDAARTSGEWDVILIEGLFALHLDYVREKLDIKVFVDLKSDERMYRRIKRWMVRESMDRIASRFLDTIRYRHDELVEPSRWYADVVINGSLATHKGTDILERYILHLLV